MFVVVWIQMRMRDLAQRAVADSAALPAAYWRLERIWVALGFPAFFGLVAVFWLMVAKPSRRAGLPRRCRDVRLARENP